MNQWFSVIAGDNDISDKFIAGDKNKGRHGGGELPRIGENRRYLRPSMSDKAADGVIGTAMKSCILVRGLWGRQNYFNQNGII